MFILSLLGNACCSDVHCRDSSIVNTWTINLSERVLYSNWDCCKFLNFSGRTLNVLMCSINSEKQTNLLSFSFYYCIASSEIIFCYQITFCSESPGITKMGFVPFVQAGYGIGSLLVDIVAGWRYMYGVSSPVAIIMGIGMWWLPASPRWLLLRAIQGKGDVRNLKDTAIHCLCRLRGQSIRDSAPQQVDEILAELSYVGEEKEVTFVEMFRGKCSKALLISSGLVLFQQVLHCSSEISNNYQTFQYIYTIGCKL